MMIIFAVGLAICALQANCFFFPNELIPNVFPTTTDASIPPNPAIVSAGSDPTENSLLFSNTFPPKPIPSIPPSAENDLHSKLQDLEDAVSDLTEHFIDALKNVISGTFSSLMDIFRFTKDNGIKNGTSLANISLSRIQQTVVLPLENTVGFVNKVVNDIKNAANLATGTIDSKIIDMADFIDPKIDEAINKNPDNSTIRGCLENLKDGFKKKSQLATVNVNKCIVDKVIEAKKIIDDIRLAIKDVCQNVQQSVGEIKACIKPVNETNILSNLKAAGCLSYVSNKAVINGLTSMVKSDKNVASTLLLLENIKISCATCATKEIISLVNPDPDFIKNSINACQS